MLCESFMPKESLVPHTQLTAGTGLSVALSHQQTHTASLYCNYTSTAAVSDPNRTPGPANKSIIHTKLRKSAVKCRPIPECRPKTRPVSNTTSSGDKNLNQIPGLGPNTDQDIPNPRPNPEHRI